jgi:hypothetical protein
MDKEIVAYAHNEVLLKIMNHVVVDGTVKGK